MAIASIKTRWIVLCLVVLPFSAQIPGCMMANTPKFGRIVDVTGKGVSNIAVIAHGEFGAERYNGGLTREYTYRVVTHTDADGNYWIPSTWTHIRFALPGMDAQSRWYITALKPGYAIATDIPAIGKLDKIPPKSLADSPSALWLGLAIRVEPIEMRPVTLSLEAASGYYGHIASLGWTFPNNSNKEEIALRRDGANYFTPRICALDPEQQIGWGSNMAAFAQDPLSFDKEIDRLDPDWLKEPVVGYRYPHFHAKTICNSLKKSWNVP